MSGTAEKSGENFSSDEFIARLRSRESKAVELIVRAYTEHLYRGALGLGFDSNGAYELAQSVWVTFFDVLPNFQGRSHIRTFLFGILYNKASEMRREQVKFNSPDPVEEVLEKRFHTDGTWAKPPMDPEEFLAASETLDLIKKCIDALPLSQRLAFCMKEIDEHGSNDICKIMNVSTTNLGVLLFRARNRLRECIEGKARKQA